MEKKKINKAIATLVIGGMLFGTSFISVAAKDTTSNSAVTKTRSTAAHFNHGEFNIGDQLKTKLDALVTKGTITQVQETNVLAYFKAEATSRQAQFEKIKAMTPAQRQALRKDNTNKPQNAFSELVKAGTITQVQADAIKGSFPSSNKGFRNPKAGVGRLGMMGMNIKPQLDKLVTSNTITQDQETKIVAYFQNQINVMKTQMDKFKTMTQAERQSLIKDKATQMSSPFADMVKAGTITQAQADAIKASLKPTQNQIRHFGGKHNKSTTK